MAKLFANSGNPDHMPHSLASDLSLHCLSVTLLGVSRLKWVIGIFVFKLSRCENIHFGSPHTSLLYSLYYLVLCDH